MSTSLGNNQKTADPIMKRKKIRSIFCRVGVGVLFMPKSWPNLSGVLGIASSSLHVEEPVGSLARFFRFKIFAKTTYKVT